MAHEHGPHSCYCPNCNYEFTADPYVQCNTLTCPNCGSRMRAKETGEFRENRSNGITAMKVSAAISTNSVPCPVCSYPIPAPSYIGQQVKCAYCGSISEAIQDVTIPNTVVVGVICFAAGAILGPAFWQAVKGSATALERLSRERIK
jgi:DNA-directed RNA polymerase subunit RPC12/RpoP